MLVRGLFRLRKSRRGRWAIGIGYGAVAVVLVLLAARHFATTSWPLSNGDPGVLLAAGVLLLLAQALKALGWARLFVRDERPTPLALAAGNGGAALIGVVLPGRFDDAMRIAVVRRYPGCPAGVRALALSLVRLGLIDNAALAPLAAVGAAFPGAGLGARAALVVVALAGIAASTVIVALPRLAASRRALRFRLGRWVSPRTTSLRRALEAWALVSACWLVRAVAFFLLLGTSSCSWALLPASGHARDRLLVSARPPLSLRRRGAGTATLVASGVGASEALATAVSVGVLGVLSGIAVLAFVVAWRAGASLVPLRTARP
jgi:hypothetical protein